MFCTQCGATISEESQFCPKCGQARIPSAQSGASAPQITPPLPPQAVGAPAAVARRTVYGGFWLRAAAYLIDGALVSVVTTPLTLLVFGMLGISFLRMGRQLPAPGQVPTPAMLAGIFGAIALFELVMVLAMWIYFAWTESSSWQATLGKKALGMRVTDLGGRRISFARATGRYFAKIISGFAFCIGFIIAGFTEKKQALHDIIAGTLVVKNA